MQIKHFNSIFISKDEILNKDYIRVYIQGVNARFWNKFYYKNADGFIVSKIGGFVVDAVKKGA